MDKEKVIRYLELLNEFQEAGKKREIKKFTEEELALIKEGNEFQEAGKKREIKNLQKKN